MMSQTAPAAQNTDCKVAMKDNTSVKHRVVSETTFVAVVRETPAIEAPIPSDIDQAAVPQAGGKRTQSDSALSLSTQQAADLLSASTTRPRFPGVVEVPADAPAAKEATTPHPPAPTWGEPAMTPHTSDAQPNPNVIPAPAYTEDAAVPGPRTPTRLRSAQGQQPHAFEPAAQNPFHVNTPVTAPHPVDPVGATLSRIQAMQS